MDRSDWNEYAGCPNQFWAAPGDRILHREISEQEELFWQEFMEGRNGKGFAMIDCSENRELLLEKYAAAFGSEALVVRSKLNELWRKYAITRSAFDHGFINPHEAEMVEAMREDERPRDANGRLLSQKEIQQREWLAWINNPETSTREIEVKKRTDRAFADFYHNLYLSQIRTDEPATTPTSRKVASEAVQASQKTYVTCSQSRRPRGRGSLPTTF